MFLRTQDEKKLDLRSGNKNVSVNMGIKGLKLLLKSSGVEDFAVCLSKLSGKTLAVDGTFILHKYKNCQHTAWQYLILFMLCCLKMRRVNAIFVFDGDPLPEKSREKTNRRNRRQAMIDKGHVLRDQLERFKTNGEISKELKAAVERLGNQKKITSDLTHANTIKYMVNYADHLTKDTRVTADDYETFRKSLDAFGFPYMDAPDEAELCCVWLTKMGFADAPLTVDSDAIACGAYHGIPIVYTDIHGDHLKAISVTRAMGALELNGDQFMDLCVMCGTDFNQRIHRLGPATALKMIRAHGSLRAIPDDVPIESLDAERTKEILIGRDITARTAEIAALKQRPVCPKKIKAVFSEELLNKLVNDNWHIRSHIHPLLPRLFVAAR
ncbi:DNA repair protein RAD2 [Singapore grouper iridovirus]|nr:DNA repair protein RAD2 [Singapore grouper iridovirus]